MLKKIKLENCAVEEIVLNPNNHYLEEINLIGYLPSSYFSKKKPSKLNKLLALIPEEKGNLKNNNNENMDQTIPSVTKLSLSEFEVNDKFFNNISIFPNVQRIHLFDLTISKGDLSSL